MLVENFRNATPKWKVIAKTGPLSYKVEIDGVIHRCHVDQLLNSRAQVVITNKPTKDMFVPQLLLILQCLNQHLNRSLALIVLDPRLSDLLT